MKWTKRKIELIILGILIVALFMYVQHFEKTQIYMPERGITITPLQYGLKFDEVNLATKDKVKINCWFIPAEKPIATFLFCHGNAGNNVDRLVSIEQFHRMNINVFIFDYRGYGKSEGSPSEQGTYKDAVTAYSYLTSRKDVDTKNIFIYGESLGGAVAIDLATRVKSNGVITIDTFTSILAISKELYPFLPIRWLMRTKYDSLSKIKTLHCPVLIAHSKEDDIIPYHHGKDLYNAANPPKEFLDLHGSHGEAIFVSDKKALAQISQFIKRSTAPSQTH